MSASASPGPGPAMGFRTYQHLLGEASPPRTSPKQGVLAAAENFKFLQCSFLRVGLGRHVRLARVGFHSQLCFRPLEGSSWESEGCEEERNRAGLGGSLGFPALRSSFRQPWQPLLQVDVDSDCRYTCHGVQGHSGKWLPRGGATEKPRSINLARRSSCLVFCSVWLPKVSPRQEM